MPRVNPDSEPEIQHLARRYGIPRRLTVPLRLAAPVRALTARPKRVAEVVFAILRTNGRLLLHTKSFYPPAAWRLPSGSIEAGESVEAALWREVREETSLSAEIVSFLAVIDYEIVLPRSRAAFRSYVFLFRETGGRLLNCDDSERVSAFREINPVELPAVAAALEALGADHDPAVAAWGDWGRYRAVVHRAVWDAWPGIAWPASSATPFTVPTEAA